MNITISKDNVVEVNPSHHSIHNEDLIEDANFTVSSNGIHIEGEKVSFDFLWSETYIEDLPSDHGYDLNKIRFPRENYKNFWEWVKRIKKPYLHGWVRCKKTTPIKITITNYKLIENK